jgi:two-component sensor histidine kinase
LIVIFPWAYHALYLSTNDLSGTYRIAITSDFSKFQDNITEEIIIKLGFQLWLNSHGKYIGALVLQSKDAAAPPQEEDLFLFKTIANLISTHLHRIEMDGKLQIKLQQLEILNQLAHVLSSSVSSGSQSKNIVKHIRRILKANIASLWIVDRSKNLLIKEAIEAEDNKPISDLEFETDEVITKWQIRHCKPYLYTVNQTAPNIPFEIRKDFLYDFISLPILLRDKIRAVLNLYSSDYRDRRALHHDSLAENMEFLRNVSGQVAVFMENRSLHKNKTFYKEMHHRVKNNLQNIVSLLRMQLRRVDQSVAKKALHDSISRIIAIAKVHETLSQGEIGMLDLSSLIETVSKQYIEGEEGPIISLDVSCPSIPVPSKQAISLALIMNELIQNSVQHSSDQYQRTTVKIKLFLEDNRISLILQDNGIGIPEDFDIESHADLGLTIVNMLVKEDLQGDFTISRLNGTIVKIKFPLPQVISTKEEFS